MENTTSLGKAPIPKSPFFFFRDMEDTAWFEEKSDDEKLTHLSELMYSDDENAERDFERLLKVVPVDLVLHFLMFDEYPNF